MRANVTQYVYGQLVSFHALVKAPWLEDDADLLADYGSNRARGHIAKGRWKLERVDLKMTPWTGIVASYDKTVTDKRHRCEPRPGYGERQAGEQRVRSARGRNRDLANAYDVTAQLWNDPKAKMSQWAADDVAKEVLARTHLNYDEARDGFDTDEDDDPVEPIAVEDLEALCQCVSPADAAMLRMRHAHPRWEWPQVADALNEAGVPTPTGIPWTGGNARKRLNRLNPLRDPDLQLYARNPHLDQDLVPKLQHHEKKPRAAQSRQPTAADIQAADTRLAELERTDFVSFVAVLTYTQAKSEDDVAQTLLDSYGRDVRAAELRKRRKAEQERDGELWKTLLVVGRKRKDWR